MTANVVGFTILLVGIGLVLGKIIRLKVSFFAKFFLPSSVIAGLLFLLLGPEVLGRMIPYEYGVFTAPIIETMSTMPGMLISVIFAGLFIGKTIPNVKQIWLTAGPQISLGQTLAWGQYVFGIMVTALVLTPLFGISPMAGALIEIAFEGGHGTAAGLSSTFSDLGFEAGADLAMGLATVGVIAGVMFGVLIINWGVRTQKTEFLKDPSAFSENELRGIIDLENRQSGGSMTVSPQSIEPLALHVGVIGIAIVIGKLLLEGLILLENLTWASDGGMAIFAYIPLFPMAMIGGVLLQLVLDKYDKDHLIDREMIKRIQGLALDFLVLSAIATLSLRVIGANIGPFLILALVGITWNVFGFLLLAKYMIPKNWFERGIGDFGQSMGMTAVGLMLIRIVDSESDTKALEAFGYKQLLFEPFVGGGVMTAISVPLIFNFGLLPVFIFVSLMLIFWLLIGLLYFGKKDEL